MPFLGKSWDSSVRKIDNAAGEESTMICKIKKEEAYFVERRTV